MQRTRLTVLRIVAMFVMLMSLNFMVPLAASTTPVTSHDIPLMAFGQDDDDDDDDGFGGDDDDGRGDDDDDEDNGDGDDDSDSGGGSSLLALIAQLILIFRALLQR